mmetsp:Transcript_22551/g.34383  ORF Transcript_22551/g.34383 Transcript_22551/m.34383 type:complete len:265 (+) Transcript_22551:173-967(+)|eukprot:CAMPEP_0196129748 /NCGR_PEP_ID=MMETSP0910-20130528/355_1 /TAXON_ID=49265 /ORGANISM="Thalassiosira rotula, Strain GSO102" /LENGTH=264 /DNA_ID=CAMNT_0041388921 /DNA_START=147 /DNA_END=941 /DNA_ORIENTATION=+
MPSIISRLNCFSKKNRHNNHNDKGRSHGQHLETDEEDNNAFDGDDVQKLLSLDPTRSMSNSTSPTNSRLENSSPSGLSPNIGKHRKEYNDDDNSIPTMDSDYKQVNSGNFSLSDAGGTFNTNNQSLTNFSHAASAFGSMAPSPNITGADAGHDYRDIHLGESPSHHRQQPPPREEYLEIHAPAGKLGLVIDTPPDCSTPVVHAIKDTCPIRSEIYVGDKLVAVDDVDVREMSATEVSRVISKKSGQERRKLVLVRTSRGRDGMY